MQLSTEWEVIEEEELREVEAHVEGRDLLQYQEEWDSRTQQVMSTQRDEGGATDPEGQ